jgi:DMSO reductase family type II enzyme chaperone
MSTATTTITIDDGTAARSELYGLVADAFEFPSKDFHLQVQARVFTEHVGALIAALPYELGEPIDLASLADARDYVAFQSEYIRLFDVGVVRPPCPLYGGEWGGARKRAMEEALRFYRFFGLKVDDGTHELPDHVTVELEFMQIMAFTEGMARARDMDTLPLLRAQRDFLERHPGKWWPLLRRKLPAQQPGPFFDALVSLTGALLAADQRYVRSLLI